MTYDELLDHNRHREIRQIGIITDDLMRDVRNWVDIARVGPWTIKDYSDRDIAELQVHGRDNRDFRFLVATAKMGNLEIELIQPVHGMPVYEDFLARHGPGLHHIKEKIGEEIIERVVEEYGRHDIPVVQTGRLFHDIHYYLDASRQLQTVIELGNCPSNNPLPPRLVSYYPAKEQ